MKFKHWVVAGWSAVVIALVLLAIFAGRPVAAPALSAAILVMFGGFIVWATLND